MRRRRSLHDSQAPSPSGSEDDEARSPLSPDGDSYFSGLKTPPVRGRKGKSTSDPDDEPDRREALDVLH